MCFFKLTTKAFVACVILLIAGPQVTTCASLAKRITPSSDTHAAACSVGQASPFEVHDCNVALNRFHYEGDNSVLQVYTYVDSPWETCNVRISCYEPSQITGGRMLTNNNQGGGYQALIEQCGQNAGSIPLTGGCVLSTQRNY